MAFRSNSFDCKVFNKIRKVKKRPAIIITSFGYSP